MWKQSAHLTQGLGGSRRCQIPLSAPSKSLSLQIALGAAADGHKGYGAPEVEQTYTRAHELCQQVGETPQLFPVL